MRYTTDANDRMNRPLDAVDPQIADLLRDEAKRQATGLELIPSENLVSEAVLEAMGSIFTNKYAEGYPGKRYYGGCEVRRQSRATRHRSRQGTLRRGTRQRASAFRHLGERRRLHVHASKPGDTVLGMNLSHGGHLTHGHPLNFSGRMYKFVAYGVKKEDERIDYDEIEKLAARAQAENDRRRRQRLFPHHRFRAHRQSRQIRRRALLRGHGAHRRTRRRRRSSQPGAACRHRFHDNAQDAARPARRHGAVQSRLRQGTGQADLPRHAGRPAGPHHRRQSRLPEGSHGAVLQGIPEAGRGQRESAGRLGGQARIPHRHRRHRQSPVPDRSPPPRHHRHRRRKSSRPRRHHREQKFHSLRSPAAHERRAESAWAVLRSPRAACANPRWSRSADWIAEILVQHRRHRSRTARPQTSGRSRRTIPNLRSAVCAAGPNAKSRHAGTV